MGVFNINTTQEGGAYARVRSLFHVLEDGDPIKRAFQKTEKLASFVGSHQYNAGSEIEIGEALNIRPGALEIVRTFPRQMLMFNKEALKEDMIQSFIDGLEYQRFIGGAQDDITTTPIISPYVDMYKRQNVDKNVILNASNLLEAYGKMNKVGRPYIVVDSTSPVAMAQVKEFKDLFPDTIVSAPRWLSEDKEGVAIQLMMTTTGAMTLGKLDDPVFSEEHHPERNEVTMRLTTETFGAEMFMNATAIFTELETQG